MSSLFCQLCREYYRTSEQEVVCPHATLTRPESLNRYGWKMPTDVRDTIDLAYRENDRDLIRTYLYHSNPLISGYANFKFEALRLAEEILKKNNAPESSEVSDEFWESDRDYYRKL